MKVEFHLNSIETFCLGIACGYGNDFHGEHHYTEIGLIIFSIMFKKY